MDVFSSKQIEIVVPIDPDATFPCKSLRIVSVSSRIFRRPHQVRYMILQNSGGFTDT